jgi:hypothetical protein
LSGFAAAVLWRKVSQRGRRTGWIGAPHSREADVPGWVLFPEQTRQMVVRLIADLLVRKVTDDTLVSVTCPAGLRVGGESGEHGARLVDGNAEQDRRGSS